MPRRTIKLKPLLRIRKPLKAVVYRARVKPFETLAYLDVKSLARARRARVEIGVVETPAGGATVVASIRNGQVVRLAPKDCANCRRRGRGPANKKLRDVLALTRVKSGVGVALPIPVGVMFRKNVGLRIPIGPIVIVIGEPDETFCIEWTTEDGTLCWWCLFDASGCMHMGPPL